MTHIWPWPTPSGDGAYRRERPPCEFEMRDHPTDLVSRAGEIRRARERWGPGGRLGASWRAKLTPVARIRRTNILYP